MIPVKGFNCPNGKRLVGHDAESWVIVQNRAKSYLMAWHGLHGYHRGACKFRRCKSTTCKLSQSLSQSKNGAQSDALPSEWIRGGLTGLSAFPIKADQARNQGPSNQIKVIQVDSRRRQGPRVTGRGLDLQTFSTFFRFFQVFSPPWV